MDYITPAVDLMCAQINSLKPIAPTVLPASQAADPKTLQLEYPQIVVQLPANVDLPTYRNAQAGLYSTHIDFYYDLQLQQSLLEALAYAKYVLMRLQLSKYPCRYVRGSQNTPSPVADTTTSRQLWHGVLLSNYEIIERG
jgi:hypothetical protein